VNLSKEPSEKTLIPEVNPSGDTSNIGNGNANGNSMEDFYNLQNFLLVTTLLVTGIISLAVWYFYSLNITLNYILGGIFGLIYFKMLGKDVERLGQQAGITRGKRLAIFAGLIIIASKVQQLSILPVFLGFLTYKIAILIYTLKVTFLEGKQENKT
jgi:ATP synthase protein I